MKKTLAGLVAAALVTAPLMSASEAQGLTDWKTFGSATTRGIGDWSDLEGVHDLVWVGAQSTTRAFPQRLRIVVTGPSQGKAEIRWSLGCWNSDSQFRVIRGFVTTGRLPRTIDLSTRVGGVWHWKWCDPDVVVIYPAEGFVPSAGPVKLLLQARYG